MAFCLNCGERLPEGATSCKSCGSPVEAAEADGLQSPSAASVDPGLNEKVRQLARQGQKIQAIKEYREATGASLKTSKDAIEAWMTSEGIARSTGAGCGTSVLLLLLLVSGGGGGIGLAVGLW